MTELERLERRLLGEVARCSADHALLEPGDRVMVAVSGGKDSHGMLHLLRELQRRAPFRFELFAVNVDQGHPGFPRELLPRYFEEQGVEYRILEEDTYSVVKEKVPEGKTFCSLCSRLRRGILYTAATREGATKIALGHHRDDLTETLLLNLFYSGQIKAMPARLHSDDGRHVVIRPLAYVAEDDLATLARLRGFPIIPCDLCGSQEDLKRKKVEALVDALHAENPNVRGNLFAALGNVRPTHLLDRELSRALGLEASRPSPGPDLG
ncbi:MAG: tRNA 2-thiocytidine(32) synthetase TtcA, partial [Deltaproteobacteria bacterium]|nr:tRNA 2-thiocytidine(32) synthetase TtcA [Deltaproteobacteria bacterium]